MRFQCVTVPSHYKHLLLLHVASASCLHSSTSTVLLPLVSISCMLADVDVYLAVHSDTPVLAAGCTLPPAGLHSKTRNPS